MEESRLRVRLAQLWEQLRASYWFLPSVMALCAVALAEAAIRMETLAGVEWLRESGWLYAYQPAGARDMLSTVAGSMITVAGVTFSMTILAISHASSQMGPRLLRDFMCDRGNQLTLGTFIATFIYCLLVLRSVRGADHSGAPDALDAFVPQLAVFLALALAIVGVAVLIYFIHHVPETLSMSKLIDRVGGTLLDRIETLYPAEIGEPAAGERPQEEVPRPVPAKHKSPLVSQERHGFLQDVDDTTLIECASDRDLVVELTRKPGDFVAPRTSLAILHSSEPVDDETGSTWSAPLRSVPRGHPGRTRSFRLCSSSRSRSVRSLRESTTRRRRSAASTSSRWA